MRFPKTSEDPQRSAGININDLKESGMRGVVRLKGVVAGRRSGFSPAGLLISQLRLVVLLRGGDGRRGNDLPDQALLHLPVGSGCCRGRDVLVAVGAEGERRVDAAVHLPGGVVLDDGVTRHHGHLSLLRLAHLLHVVGDVDDAAEHVVVGREAAGLEDPLGEHRGEDEEEPGDHHGQRAEGEELNLVLLIIPRVPEKGGRKREEKEGRRGVREEIGPRQR